MLLSEAVHAQNCVAVTCPWKKHRMLGEGRKGPDDHPDPWLLVAEQWSCCTAFNKYSDTLHCPALRRDDDLNVTLFPRAFLAAAPTAENSQFLAILLFFWQRDDGLCLTNAHLCLAASAIPSWLCSCWGQCPPHACALSQHQSFSCTELHSVEMPIATSSLALFHSLYPPTLLINLRLI